MVASPSDPSLGAEKLALHLDLEPNLEAPSLARAAITGFCQDRGLSAKTIATVTLLVSEIVTNAIVHSGVAPPAVVRLCARLDPRTIRVQVSDEGAGFTPRPRDPAMTGGGYGLHLLEKGSARWGVSGPPGATVWFEVAAQAC
jgi:anti-sigma regulatory factor (Ser/Thr protein kinase)